MTAAAPPAADDPDGDDLPPIPKPTAETHAAAARLGLSADDLALIEAEHGVLDVGALLKLTVHEYANMLGRRRLFSLKGRIRWVGYDVDPAEDDSADSAGAGSNEYPAAEPSAAAIA